MGNIRVKQNTVPNSINIQTFANESCESSLPVITVSIPQALNCLPRPTQCCNANECNRSPVGLIIVYLLSLAYNATYCLGNLNSVSLVICLYPL